MTNSLNHNFTFSNYNIIFILFNRASGGIYFKGNKSVQTVKIYAELMYENHSPNSIYSQCSILSAHTYVQQSRSKWLHKCVTLCAKWTFDESPTIAFNFRIFTSTSESLFILNYRWLIWFLSRLFPGHRHKRLLQQHDVRRYGELCRVQRTRAQW